MSRRNSSDGALFIGRLSKNCRVRDLEDVFEPYGRMSRCEIKYGAEMAYAFVDYEDRRDAEDAIRFENGRDVAGSAIIVEWAKGAPRRSYRDREVRESSRSGRGGIVDECYRCHRSGHWARDCPDDNHYGFRRPSRRSRSPRKRRSRSRSNDNKSRSRSYDGKRRTRSRSRSQSEERISRSRSRSLSGSKSRSRSRSVEDKGVNGEGDIVETQSHSPSAEREPTST